MHLNDATGIQSHLNTSLSEQTIENQFTIQNIFFHVVRDSSD